MKSSAHQENRLTYTLTLQVKAQIKKKYLNESVQLFTRC